MKPLSISMAIRPPRPSMRPLSRLPSVTTPREIFTAATFRLNFKRATTHSDSLEKRLKGHRPRSFCSLKPHWNAFATSPAPARIPPVVNETVYTYHKYRPCKRRFAIIFRQNEPNSLFYFENKECKNTRIQTEDPGV